MEVSFDQLPDHARLWVYQALTPFSREEMDTIRRTVETFIESWQAHGKPLTAAYDICFDQFIILAVDESVHGATGCSIDGSVALVRSLEQHLNRSLLDRSMVAVQTKEGIKVFPFNEVKRNVEQGTIAADDTVFNNSVATVSDFHKEWKLPAAQSWIKRHFKVTQ